MLYVSGPRRKHSLSLKPSATSGSSEDNKIQYFRVEGGRHKYKMLYLVSREGQKEGKECNVVFYPSESAEYDRYIYYVKAY